MTAADKFNRLMDVIDYWTEEEQETERYAGSFRHLSRELWIKEVCVTPGCSVSVAKLKTFLACAVLQIYPWNNKSKVSYRDIRRFLAGEDDRKRYSFFFGELEKCFSVKENGEAAKRSQLCKNCYPLMGDMEEEGMVSLYLLEKLQTMMRVKTGEYWRMCDLNFEQPGLKRDRQETVEDKAALAPKQNKYMECLMIVALHEIFVRECEKQLKELQENIRTRQGSVAIAKEKTEALAKKLFDADEESVRTWMEDAQVSVREVEEYTRQVSKGIFLLCEYVEHVIGAEAEILMFMVLETKNLEIMRRDASLGRQMTDYLEFMKEKSTENFFNYNKNREKYYRQLETEIKKIFICYMAHIGASARLCFAEALRTYMEIVENGRFDEEKRKKLWEAQFILALPVWYAAGEGESQEAF